jgi:hypothetical protein
MYKALLLVMICFSATAQEKTELKHYEIRTNVLSTFSQGNYNLSFEKKTSGNLTFGISGSITQSATLTEKFNNGNNANLPVWDITTFARYKLSKGSRSHYFAEVFSSLNHGQFKSFVRKTDDTNYANYIIEKERYTDVALGGGLGYKLLIQSKWTLEFFVGFGANIFNTKQSPNVVSRVGLNVGYQF